MTPRPQHPQSLAEAILKELNDHWLVISEQNRKPLIEALESVIASHSSSPAAAPQVPESPLTDAEFGHLAFRLNDCRCETCQSISIKLCDMRKEAKQAAAEARAEVQRRADDEFINLGVAISNHWPCTLNEIKYLIDGFRESLRHPQEPQEEKIK